MTFLQLYTLFHTALSLVAIISGLLVVKGFISSAGRQLWTLLFLFTGAATTVTGFFFPFNGVTPALILGIISIVPLTLAFMGRYRYRLAGAWRGTYVLSAVLILYFNCFVLVVQSFQKIPLLNVLAPTQTELPFKMAQLLTLVLFMLAAKFSFRNYRPTSLENALPKTYVSPLVEKE